METEFVICEDAETARRLAVLIVNGLLPRLYTSAADAILARQRYPRFGGGRHFYEVFGVTAEGEVSRYAHDPAEAA